MKRAFVFITFLSFINIWVWADEIPVEEFFRAPQYLQMKISPDGEYLAFTYSEGTEIKIAVLSLKTKEVTTTFGFGEYTKVENFHWVSDDRFIVEYVKSIGYLDNSASFPTLVASNADGTERAILFQGQANVRENVVAVYRIISLMLQDENNILIARQHVRDDRLVKAYKLNVYTGKLDYTGLEPSNAFRIVADKKGNVRFAVRYDEKDSDKFGEGTLTLLFRSDNSDGWSELKVPGYKKGSKFIDLGFSDDQKRLFFHTPYGDGIDNVYEFNFTTKSIKQIFSSYSVEIDQALASSDGIIGFSYTPDKVEYHYFDDSKTSRLLKKLTETFNEQRVQATSFTADGKLVTLKVSSDKNRGDYYLFDLSKNKATYLASISPGIDPDKMADMIPITFATRDEETIHGYLTLPKASITNNPMIVIPHGGPHGVRDYWGFDSEAQFFANRGYAVLQINFRGSGGYGTKFQEMGYRRWGREMQNDITDGTMWALDRGFAAPGRVCIYGVSYGGYAALMGVINEPFLYQCAAAAGGVYSLPMMFETGDTIKRKSGVRTLERYIGTDEEELKRYSPLYNVDKIKVPLMLIHGGKDVRVPIDHYNALSQALKARGTPFETIINDNEGHSFVQYQAKVDLYKRLEAFFDKHIGQGATK